MPDNTEKVREYAFRATLSVEIRVKGKGGLQAAVEAINTTLQAASFNHSVSHLIPDEGIESLDITDAIVIDDPDSSVEPIKLFQVDGEDLDDSFEIDEVEECPSCGAIEGTSEWGTVGDGFDGYCPSCADRREASGEVEADSG